MEWISVDQQMPEPGKKVIAYYKNRAGKGRRIIAHYLPRYFAESDAEADSYDEYHEETDTYYYHEGWWEQVDNWGDFSCIYVNEGEVIKWMPLPEPPKETE